MLKDPEKNDAVRAEDHLGLVRRVVNRFRPGEEFDDSDLYAAGCLALVEAARTFDPSRSKFSTWASRIVLQRVVDEMRRSGKDPEASLPDDFPSEKGAGMPVHLVEGILALRKSDSREERAGKRLLRGRYLEEKTLSQLGVEMGVSKEAARKRVDSAISMIRSKNRELLENAT